MDYILEFKTPGSDEEVRRIHREDFHSYKPVYGVISDRLFVKLNISEDDESARSYLTLKYNGKMSRRNELVLITDYMSPIEMFLP